MFVPNRIWAEHLLSYRLLASLGATGLAETLQQTIDSFFRHRHLYDEAGWRKVPWDLTILYETHVKGFTKRHPQVPENLRGTYAGFGSRPAVDYLSSRPDIDRSRMFAFAHGWACRCCTRPFSIGVLAASCCNRRWHRIACRWTGRSLAGSTMSSFPGY